MTYFCPACRRGLTLMSFLPVGVDPDSKDLTDTDYVDFCYVCDRCDKVFDLNSRLEVPIRIFEK